MHPFVAQIVAQKKDAGEEFRSSLKKAFDLLGNTYAPLFFCAACVMGIALPLFAWKSGGVLNALLGARGVGTLTNEFTQGVWVMIVALMFFLGARILLDRLEGKMHAVFMQLAEVAQMLTLFLLSASFLYVLLMHALLFLLWNIFLQTYVRAGIATAWFLGLVWLVFSFATDIVLRVSTIGDMVSVLLLCGFFFYATTKKFLMRKA